MENASKALIIAGAILIAILLIGIGMYLYSAAQAPISQAGSQMDQQAIQMFNAKFENYDGKQSGTNVKSLISAVITNNSSDSNARIVTVNGKSSSADLSTLRSAVVNSRSYTVNITYDSNGLVSAITY